MTITYRKQAHCVSLAHFCCLSDNAEVQSAVFSHPFHTQMNIWDRTVQVGGYMIKKSAQSPSPQPSLLVLNLPLLAHAQKGLVSFLTNYSISRFSVRKKVHCNSIPQINLSSSLEFGMITFQHLWILQINFSPKQENLLRSVIVSVQCSDPRSIKHRNYSKAFPRNLRFDLHETLQFGYHLFRRNRMKSHFHISAL